MKKATELSELLIFLGAAVAVFRDDIPFPTFESLLLTAGFTLNAVATLYRMYKRGKELP